MQVLAISTIINTTWIILFLWWDCAILPCVAICRRAPKVLNNEKMLDTQSFRTTGSLISSRRHSRVHLYMTSLAPSTSMVDQRQSLTSSLWPITTWPIFGISVGLCMCLSSSVALTNHRPLVIFVSSTHLTTVSRLPVHDDGSDFCECMCYYYSWRIPTTRLRLGISTVDTREMEPSKTMQLYLQHIVDTRATTPRYALHLY
jgi:hypothetical protein